jgi:hypothetical protein
LHCINATHLVETAHPSQMCLVFWQENMLSIHRIGLRKRADYIGDYLGIARNDEQSPLFVDAVRMSLHDASLGRASNYPHLQHLG